jgi:hypothetical protein
MLCGDFLFSWGWGPWWPRVGAGSVLSVPGVSASSILLPSIMVTSDLFYPSFLLGGLQDLLPCSQPSPRCSPFSCQTSFLRPRNRSSCEPKVPELKIATGTIYTPAERRFLYSGLFCCGSDGSRWRQEPGGGRDKWGAGGLQVWGHPGPLSNIHSSLLPQGHGDSQSKGLASGKTRKSSRPSG